MTHKLLDHPFDPYAELQKHEAERQAQAQEQNQQRAATGATATFVGTMRDNNDGERVTSMLLEHYSGMTEKQLDSILDQARQRWDIQDALIVHRIGQINPGEPIVLTAVWSAHRAAAFEACRFLMEELKSKATFWKKETLADESTRWVASNTAGYTE